MPTTIFFSWASDPPTNIGRNFIERTLESAIRNIGSDSELIPAARDQLVVDRDTNDEPGHPSITDTIFKKIDIAAVYVCDLTLVATRINNKGGSPNPNVLIEYGYAFKSRGYSRIVAVMNTAFGEPNESDMPFNMRHRRNPICFNLPDNADEATRRTVRQQLQRELETAIKLILKGHPPQETMVEPFPSISAAGYSRWVTFEGTFGLRDAINGAGGGDLFMQWRPEMWLRLMPLAGPGLDLSLKTIRAAIKADELVPMIALQYGGQTNSFRHEQGAGVYLVGEPSQITESAVAIFRQGELWAVDSALIAAQGEKEVIPFIEPIYKKALKRYLAVLHSLGVQPPLRWIAGIRGIRGHSLTYPATPNPAHLSLGGGCAIDFVIEEGVIDGASPPDAILNPFFNKLFDQCGTDRPAYLMPR
jgi:hypothetical protein